MHKVSSTYERFLYLCSEAKLKTLYIMKALSFLAAFIGGAAVGAAIGIL